MHKRKGERKSHHLHEVFFKDLLHALGERDFSVPDALQLPPIEPLLSSGQMDIDDVIYYRQISRMFTKTEGLNIDGLQDPSKKAIQSFVDLQVELGIYKNDLYREFAGSNFAVLLRSEIAKILEYEVPYLDSPAELFYTSGANLSVSHVEGVCTFNKISTDKPTTTYRAVRKATSMLNACFSTLDCFCKSDKLNLVKAARLTTVPKNYRTDRVICVEPSVNNLFQKWIGNKIRERLKMRGLNLDSNQLNIQYSRIGSIDQTYSTIDLSHASDSITGLMVMDLLPPEWFELLYAFRTDFVEVAGDPLELESFSTMGNGFTFEVESLIFYAVTKTLYNLYGLREKPIVFGDDIVVRTEMFTLLKSILTEMGFDINESKTFSGCFTESCGHDWYCGVNVTPFYVRTVKNTPDKLISLANQIRLRAARNLGFFSESKDLQVENLFYMCDSSLKNAWVTVYKEIPTEFQQCKGPLFFGDLVLWDSYPYDQSEFKTLKPRKRTKIVNLLSVCGDRWPRTFFISTRMRKGKPQSYSSDLLLTPSNGRLSDIQTLFTKDGCSSGLAILTISGNDGFEIVTRKLSPYSLLKDLFREGAGNGGWI